LKKGSVTTTPPLFARQVVGAPNLCSVPDEDYGPSAGFLFGDCVFTTPDPLSTALTTVRRNQGSNIGSRVWFKSGLELRCAIEKAAQ